MYASFNFFLVIGNHYLLLLPHLTANSCLCTHRHCRFSNYALILLITKSFYALIAMCYLQYFVYLCYSLQF